MPPSLEHQPRGEKQAPFAELLKGLTHVQEKGTAEPRRLPLTLRRSGFLKTSGLALEYITDTGEAVAGQWFADGRYLRHVARRIRGRSGGRVSIANSRAGAVILQEAGADRRLRGLAELAAEPGAQILAHRAEHRAVVRVRRAGADVFAKIVRAGKVEAIAGAGRAAATLGGDEFKTPQLAGADIEAGVVYWSALEGRPLYSLCDEPEALVSGWRQAGEVLSALHARPTVEIDKVHDAAAEAEVVNSWMERLRSVSPEFAESLSDSAADVISGLAAGDSRQVVLHRDFHDKQVLIDPGGPPGLIDFDTLAVGEAALDVANALVHIELRVAQGRLAPQEGEAAQAAFLEAYRPDCDTRERLQAYADASALRLACVYSFRPGTEGCIDALLERFTTQLEKRL